MKRTTNLVIVYTVLLGLLGAGLLFLPELMVAPGAESFLLAQLIGAACLGFAIANWTARHLVLGGIYGRSVVVGNQAFAFIGFLLVVGNLPEQPRPAFWFLVFVLAAGALLFSVLMFRPSWLQTESDGSVT
jgi:hypothetical protein